MFGTSGHQTKPPGLVIESFDRRTDDPDFNTHIKSIVDPARTEAYCNNPHFFFYTDGTAVNENGVPVEGAKSEHVSFERLRLNHYWTKSEEEALAKFGRSRADDGTVREPPDFSELDRNLNQKQDEAIKTYVPDLQKALEARRMGSAGLETGRSTDLDRAPS